MQYCTTVDATLSALVKVLAGWQTAIPGQTCDVSVWVASLIAMAVAWVLWHYRDRAVFTHPIASNMPVVPGGQPLLGHTYGMLRNLHRAHHWLMENARSKGFRTVAGSLPTLPTFYLVSTYWQQHAKRSQGFTARQKPA